MLEIDCWLRSLRANFGKVALAMGLIFLATVCVVLFYPRKYASNAQLLLRVGRESVRVDPTADATGESLPMQLTRESEIETALGVMRSRAVLEEVVEKVGVETIDSGYLPGDAADSGGIASAIKGVLSPVFGLVQNIDPVPARERAIRDLGSDLHVSNQGKASVVSISYNTKSKEVANQVVTAWVEAYLHKHAEFHTTSGSYEFFQAEDEKLKQELEDTYAKLRETKNRFGLTTIDGHQQLLEGRMAALRDLKVDVESSKSASESKVAELQRLLESTDDRTQTEQVSGKANEAHDAMRAKLFELEVTEQEYRTKYKDEHPRLVSIERQIAEVREILSQQDPDRNEVSSDVNPTHKRLEQELALEKATLKSLTTKCNSLAQQYGKLAEEIAELNKTESQIAELTRNVKIMEESYVAHSQRLEQARLDEALLAQRITSVNVVQSPTLEHRPVSPNKMLTAALGLFGMLATLVGLPLLFAEQPSQSKVETTTKPERPAMPEDPAVTEQKRREKLLDPMYYEQEAITE